MTTTIAAKINKRDAPYIILGRRDYRMVQKVSQYQIEQLNSLQNSRVTLT